MTKFGQRIVSASVNSYRRVFAWFDHTWSTSHPSTYRVFHLFKGGIRLSFSDLEQFAKARARLLTGEHLRELSVGQLEALRRVPGDLVTVTPALIVAILPASVLILPFFYLFPRKLLTSRFWSEEQRKQFQTEDFQKRLLQFPKLTKIVLKKTRPDASELKAALTEVRFEKCFQLYWNGKGLSFLQFQITNGNSLDQSAIHTLHPFFRRKPFSYSTMSLFHVEVTCRCHACRHFRVAQRSRLKTYARLLISQDEALRREGMANLTRWEKEELCLTRGLLPFDLNDSQIEEFLSVWTSCSAQLDPVTDLSLFLHLPIFLSQHWHSSNYKAGG